MTETWDTKKKGMVFTKVKDQKAICISASNIVKNQEHSTSYFISELIAEVLEEKGVLCEILDLRHFELAACTGCDGCGKGVGCIPDADFNRIYEKLEGVKYLFFIAPYCAPIPAKLSMLLEKLEKMNALPCEGEAAQDAGQSSVLAGIVSYGAGDGGKYQNKIVNDIIAEALERMQMKTIPYNSKWDTGISLPVDHEGKIKEPGYDREMLGNEIEQYVKVVLQTAKSLHAIV